MQAGAAPGGRIMLKTVLRKLAQISRRIYVRVIMFAVLDVIALLGAVALSPFIPDGAGSFIGADAVDTILRVLASSMLAVTTFSLTIMTAAFANAASNWTPRSHLVLREDTVTHSVLATFLGSYMFALVAIVMRAAGLFDHRGIVVLFFVTIAVVLAIVVSIIRWIVRLEGLGSLPFTAARLEEEAGRAMRRAAVRPCHGGHCLRDPATQIPAGAVAITGAGHGYVQQIFEAALQSWAEANGARVYVPVSVGEYVQTGDVLAHVVCDGEPDAKAVETLREAIPVRDVRSFEQDPVFGISVLAEIATRALSPGINDPGTAIDVAHRISHVLRCRGADDGDGGGAPEYDRLWCVALDPDELFRSSYDPISREAGDCVEVQIAVQNALRAVVAGLDGAMAQAARDCAARCRDRAVGAIRDAADRDLFRERLGDGGA